MRLRVGNLAIMQVAILMETEPQEDCRDLFAPHWEPPSNEPCDVWIERELELGAGSDMQGRVRFDAVPMARYFLQACQSELTKYVVLMVSAQSAKTKTAQFFLIWSVLNKPRETIWYMDTNESAKLFSQTRLQADLDGCDKIRVMLPLERDKNKWSLVQFDTMNLYIMGANAKRNRERISAEMVLCDERRNYPPGAMQGIRNRYKTFRNAKEISFSTAGNENDDLHRAFMEGSQTFFHFSCPNCKHSQPLRFGRDATTLFPKSRPCGGIVWDDNETTHPDENTYNFVELLKTVRYECENENCRHHFHNSEKAALILTIHPVSYNPIPTPEHASFHWNELYMPWAETSWERIVQKFITANLALRLKGDIEPLKTFVQESLGEPWRDASEQAEPAEILKRCGEYQMGEEWALENGEAAVKIMTIDVQKDYLKYIVRQHRENHGSRLIEAGRFEDEKDARACQERHGIPDEGVGIDCAWFTKTSRKGTAPKVLEWCAEFGWRAMLGDSPSSLYRTSITDRRGQLTHIERPWKITEVDSGMTMATRRKVKRIVWQNDHYKNKLYLQRIKGQGMAWELPMAKSLQDNVPLYIGEMTCTELVTETNPVDNTQRKVWKERSRHDFADCEQMQLVFEDVLYADTV